MMMMMPNASALCFWKLQCILGLFVYTFYACFSCVDVWQFHCNHAKKKKQTNTNEMNYNIIWHRLWLRIAFVLWRTMFIVGILANSVFCFFFYQLILINCLVHIAIIKMSHFPGNLPVLCIDFYLGFWPIANGQWQ